MDMRYLRKRGDGTLCYACTAAGPSPDLSNEEKKRRLMVARKSYATVEELKGISLAAATAITVENRGGKSSDRGVGGNKKTALGYRQF